MNFIIANWQIIAGIIIPVAILIIEYFVGKSKGKENSILEVILKVLKKIVSFKKK